jgi:RNA polymerase sigma-70 factor (ECF subfamily)
MTLEHAAVADSPAAAGAAFADQIETHRAYLTRAARLKLRDAGDVEDVVQEAMIAAWKARAGFRGQSALRTWLVGILNHKIVDLIRERQRHATVSLDALDAADAGASDDSAGLHAVHGFAQVSEGAAIAYERRALCEHVLCELEAYSPKAAQIFVMREIEGEETGAICRRLAVSSANCYVLLHRARQFLHQRFAQDALAA